MKIAFPLAENKGAESLISAHFGHAPFFGFASWDDTGSVVWEVEANQFEHQAHSSIPGYMKSKGATHLLAGGMGMRAVEHVNNVGLELIRGVSGKAAEVLEKFRAGELQDNPSASPCGGHGHSHHGNCH